MTRGHDRRTRRGLLLVSAAALAVRLVALGARTVHWDEARVGLVTLRYLHTGVWSYDPLVHGPLLFHLNRVAFAVLGPGAVAMRLVPAVVGGLLPLSAWLFRDRLAPDETLALGVVLAANPLFLYYSRFARNDVPLAAAMLVTLGLLVRARDTGRGRYLVAAGVASALGFGLKENAALYLLCWAAAAALVAASRRLRAGEVHTGAASATLSLVADTLDRLSAWTRRRWPSVVAAVLAWSLVVVFLYAPRDPSGLGLRAALGDPPRLPALLSAATVEPVSRAAGVWLTGGSQALGPRTLFYAVHHAAVVGVGAGATALLAVVGVASAVRSSESRPLVSAAAVWAVCSLLGYPLATDLAAPWLAVHTVAALAIPAAVGLAALVRHGRSPGGRRAAATLLLLALAAQVVAVGATTSYVAPDARLNLLGQPAQPGPDAARAGRAIDRATCPGDAVLFYGDYFDPRYGWRRLPLSWDVARVGASATFAPTGSVPASPPPVVVALSGRHPDLGERVAGYDRYAVELDPWVAREPAAPVTTAVVYIDSRARARSRCVQSPTATWRSDLGRSPASAPQSELAQSPASAPQSELAQSPARAA
ncbi:MAG: flippase activity-associated protein Agl23 [Haloferacaceae archaeon]